MSWQLPCETTDTVAFEASEPNEDQYPGLPMTGEKSFIYTAITDGIPSMDLHKRLDAQYGDDHRILVCTIDEVHAMRNGLPSVYHRFTETFPQLRLEPTMHNKARMLQTQSELLARISTISAALIHGRRDLETVISKERQYCRVGRLLAGLGLPIHIDPLDAAPYTDERMDDILLHIKSGMLALYDRVGWPLTPVDDALLRGDLTAAERRKYGFIDHYRALLGDNWVAGFAYGSSVRTDDEEQFDDLDTTLLVRDIPAAYALLRGTRPHFSARTRVVGGAGKHIGINLFPANGTMFAQYARSLDDVTEFREHIKVLHGEVPFPIVSEQEELERGCSHAFLKSKTLADSVGRYIREPTRLLGKPNLFEFFVKNVRFIFKHAMKLETGETLAKEGLQRLLRERHGIRIPKYKEDPAYLADAIVYARVCSAFLQQTYLRDVRFRWEYYTADLPVDNNVR